jgi:4-hydroxy-2-oxoheptanedioate aldolase
VATLPVTGTSAEAIWSNAWQIGHLLAAGVYGILLCHAESPAAVKAFVEATRWAFAQVGRDRLEVGRRGGGGQGYAAQIWGVPVAEYMAKSDPWPLNPKGELILGLKIENRRALANVETSLTVPGIAFAEWGPGDMGMSLGDVDYYLPGDDHRPNPDFGHDPPYGPIMQAAQERVARACRQNGVVFYSTMREVDWRRHYDLGSRASSASPQTVPIIELIRRHAGRTMPV